MDLFLTFADRHHKHIVTGDLWIIRNNALRKLFIKDLNIEGLDNCISSWCHKNGVDKSFFLE